jgi:hypothetical protein
LHSSGPGGQDLDQELFHQILQNEQKLVDAIAIGDTATWLGFLYKDCLIAVEDGKMLSFGEFISSLKPLPAGFSGHIKIIDPVFRHHDNTAVISFVDDEFLELFGQKIHTQYRQTNTWKEIDGRWQIIALQLFEIPKNPPPVVVTKSILERYAGTYALSEERQCVVTLEDTALFAQKSGRAKEELLAETANVFFRKEDGRVRVLFIDDGKGGINMVERRAGEDVIWKREN